MKYLIRRTSGLPSENPGIKGVQKEILPFSYTRIWEGNRRDEELKEAYTIELDSLEALHQFIKDCGCDIIISNPSKQGYGFQLPEIEVYDTYRE